MVIDEISEMLANRRMQLVDLLENGAQNIELEKQHQIYGAINEIDVFLQTLNYFQQTGIENDIGQIKLARPAEKKDIFSQLFEGLKGKVKKNR